VLVDQLCSYKKLDNIFVEDIGYKDKTIKMTKYRGEKIFCE